MEAKREGIEAVKHGWKKGRAEQRACAMQLSGREVFQECNKREGVGLASNVDTCGVDLRTRTRQLGAKEKARRKKCEVLICQMEPRLLEELHEEWCEELAEEKLCFARVRGGGQAVGIYAYRKVEIEKADGGSSRQERVGVAISFHVGE